MQIQNKKARFNYKLLERFEAGIVLAGSEAKAMRTKGADLSNSYVKIVNDEAFLINVNIPIKGKSDYDPTRTRKLLLHKKEIISIASRAKAKKLTLIPVRMYNKGRIFKVELALARSRRKFEKKQLIKKRDIEREIERQTREGR